MIRHLRARRPTKGCPHWLCRPLHTLLGIEAVIFLALIVMNGWAMILLSVLLGVVCLGIVAAVYGKSPIDAVTEQLLSDRIDTIAVVRRGWARVAAACDVWATAGATNMEIFQIWHPSTPMTPSGASLPANLVSTLGGLAFVALTLYAHRAATRPGRTQRALVFARGEN